ncbi:Crp/Fnr family transcriptional regulator [Cucumibacter marinus]|uniref:Crp/Fnr family transcriptional regulator n=1 Tax=Cucumibacter marinus TaxID=1121252 RepID=UPI000409B3B4|nr:Crp/Fnr family transcriptional regulator [Cucumibacter marinus]
MTTNGEITNGPGLRARDCTHCPLRKIPAFREFCDEELDFVSRFKRGELTVAPGATVLTEGSNSPHLYTVLEGWGFRYKTLEDGSRQILNYVMPGDLVGLQSAVMNEMQHSVEALKPMTLCVFDRRELFDLYRSHPGLAFDVTWLAAREEQMLDENILSLGRRSARQRAAYLLCFLNDRRLQCGLSLGRDGALPLTQQHVADTLGFSLVHTNKTLKKLATDQLVKWTEDGCVILEPEKLADLADWQGLGDTPRPFI